MTKSAKNNPKHLNDAAYWRERYRQERNRYRKLYKERKALAVEYAEMLEHHDNEGNFLGLSPGQRTKGNRVLHTGHDVPEYVSPPQAVRGTTPVAYVPDSRRDIDDCYNSDDH